MKRLVLILATAFLLSGACKAVNTEEAENKGIIDAAGFTAFNLEESFEQNPFTEFKGKGLLICVGDKESNNAMTIGWGSLGNLWGKIGANTVTIYVAEGRYTYQFLEKYKYFTVMTFEEKDANILEYMGTHSGRDGDKAQALGLHTLYTENGTPYYQEASSVLECEIIYKAPFEREGMCESAQKFYDRFSAGVHHIYIGNVVSALRKE